MHTLAGTGWRYCLNKGIGSYLSKRRLSEDKVIAAHPPLSAWMSSIGFALKSLSSRTCARVDRSPPLFDRLKKNSYDHRCAQRTRTNLSSPWIVVSLVDDREEERRKLEGERARGRTARGAETKNWPVGTSNERERCWNAGATKHVVEREIRPIIPRAKYRDANRTVRRETTMLATVVVTYRCFDPDWSRD